MIRTEQLVEQLSMAVRGCSPAERSALLDRRCGDSPELRHLVEERLLAEGFDDRSTLNWSAAVSSAVGSPQSGRSDHRNDGRFTPGQVIAARFTVIRYIARGGMGEVYEVEDRLLQGAHVALKMILPGIANDANSSRRFEQEVLLARKVIHPNLCPIYDIARADDPSPPFLFLTMKLLSGETLSSRLRQPEPIGREEAIAIFRQMVAGLAAIHAAGVIHRDIKPNNVMLHYSGPSLCLSIMDFGLALLHEQEETIATGSLVVGTPGYMAPEVLQGQGPSQAADVFALGVVLHQVLARERPGIGSVSFAVEPSSALDAADAPAALVHAVKEFLSNDPNRRCIAFEQIQSTLTSDRGLNEWEYDKTAGSSGMLLTRRHFVIGSIFAASAVAGSVAWKWDRLYDLVHPLPAKRFVALLNWPPPDARVKPMLLGVIDAISSELARAEAFDRNLLVIAPQRAAGDLTTPAQLNEARESLGANLVLAASGTTKSNELHLLLRVLDPSSASPLRAKQVRVPLHQQETLPAKAVRAAAELLDITAYKPDDQRSRVGTDNPEAYVAFQAAESLRTQENDAGLDAAIEKYKQAIEIDPRYAVAQARLAWAYLRSYPLHGDPAALTLASLNCKSAIQLDPGLVDAHLGLASVYQQRGDDQGASDEMSKALSLDPSNPHTLIYQANFYAAANRWREAEQTFERALNLRPNYWLGHQELGVVLDLQGKYSQALTEFRSASLAAPKNALALKNVGSVYLQLGKLPEALEKLNASFNMKQDDQTAQGLAEVYRVQHKYSEAIDYGERSVKLGPNEPGNWLELGDVYWSAGGRYRTEATAAYRQAASTQTDELQTSPKDGPGWMVLALCGAKLGEPEKALTLVAKAESLHADDMDSQLYKVRALELAGRRDAAMAAIVRCLSRGASPFQFDSMPDLERLRATPEYKSMMANATAANLASL
jgi:serine/threonine protein kinase/Tfp pilus assembly protein PilF